MCSLFSCGKEKKEETVLKGWRPCDTARRINTSPACSTGKLQLYQPRAKRNPSSDGWSKGKQWSSGMFGLGQELQTVFCHFYLLLLTHWTKGAAAMSLGTAHLWVSTHMGSGILFSDALTPLLNRHSTGGRFHLQLKLWPMEGELGWNSSSWAAPGDRLNFTQPRRQLQDEINCGTAYRVLSKISSF